MHDELTGLRVYAPDPEVEIQGGAADLLALADALLRPPVRLRIARAPDADYGEPLRAIRIERDDEPGVAYRVDGDELVIVGDHESLAVLADNVRFAASPDQLGQHSHHEYFDGYSLFRADSVPAIVYQT